MRTLRQELRRLVVSRWMAKMNGLSPELAAYHVRQMDDEELRQRAWKITLAGMELSAAGPPVRPGNVSSTRFSRPGTEYGRSAALNPVPGAGEVLPDPEAENRGKPEADRRFVSGGRLDHPDGVGFAVASRV